MKKDIRAYTYEQLAAEMEQIGEKKFRAKQIYEWLHVKLADSFEEMTNLSKALREKLEAEYEILPVKMLLPSVGWREICRRLRCWGRFIKSRRSQEKESPMLL